MRTYLKFGGAMICIPLLLASARWAAAAEPTVSASSQSLRLTLRLKDANILASGAFPSVWFEVEIKNESKARQEIIENAFLHAGRPESWGTPDLEVIDSRGRPVRLALPEPCPPTERPQATADDERKMAPRLRDLESSLRKQGASEEDIRMMLDLERQAIREDWTDIRRSWLAPGAGRRSLPYSEPRIDGCSEIPTPAPTRFSELKIGGFAGPGKYRIRAVYSDAARGRSGIRIVTPWMPILLR